MGKCPKLIIGLEHDHVKNPKEALDAAVQQNFNYILSKLVQSVANDHCIETGEPVPCPEFWHDSLLTPAEWQLGLVSVVPNPPELESEDRLALQRASQALSRLLEYSHHLGISAIMFELTAPSNNMAQIINGRMNQIAAYFSFWVKVPYGSVDSAADVDGETDEAWKNYNTFRKLCGVERKMVAVLQLNRFVPTDSAKLERWKGEMVIALSIPMSIFLTNESGYPVLPKAHQAAVKKFLPLRTHLILEADVEVSGDALQFYVEYLRHLDSALVASLSNSIDESRYFAPGRENHLGYPMQPLADHLSYKNYHGFEMDPVKYKLYKDALAMAFRKRLPTEELRAATELVVIVAGAGRGPLVNMTFDAAGTEGAKVKVYALEKNPSAEVRLHFLNKTRWEKKVTIVSADMRYWNPSEKVDIIVSELLGSFGDNELSPECLDGAQRFLKDDGIMIPGDYTSFVTPVMSHPLHVETDRGKYVDSVKNYENTYVCLSTRKYDIAASKELFKFTHPHPVNEAGASPADKWTNARYKTLEFNVTQDCDCHGFVGHFDSTLFSDGDRKVTMSIHPDTYSGRMQSWFPLFIPLKEGVSLRKGDKLVASFWRRCTTTRVWYEWTVVAPTALKIHNVNGRSSFMGLDFE